MGYTHYWRRDEAEIPQELWDEAISKIRPIVAEHSKLLSDVEITEDVIFFNGGHETFFVQRIFEHPEWVTQGYRDSAGFFRFCKTARKPYDKVVVACLVVLATVLRDAEVGFRWSSDGETGDHAEGLRISGVPEALAVGAQSDV